MAMNRKALNIGLGKGKADELSVFDALRDVLCARVRPEQVVSRTDGERWRAYLLVRGGPEGCGRLSIRA